MFIIHYFIFKINIKFADLVYKMIFTIEKKIKK